MKLLCLIIAAYFALAFETTIAPDLFGAMRCGIFLWPIVPFIALLLRPSSSIVFAACYGLAIDALGSGRLGVCSILCVLAVLLLQRVCTAAALSKLGRTIGLTFATSVALSMTLFVVESLLHAAERPAVAPSRFVVQLLVTSVVGAVVAGLVSTSLRIIGMKRPNSNPFAAR